MFLRRKLLSHSTEKFRWGTVRRFKKFRVSENFMLKKGISLNSVEKFLSHSADKLRWRTLLCFKKFWYRKFSSKGGGSFKVLSKFFLSHRTEKTSPGNHSVFQKISGREKFSWIRRGMRYHDFPSKSFCLTTKIFHWRTLWCFKKFF